MLFAKFTKTPAVIVIVIFCTDDFGEGGRGAVKV
jgi:hypothetical protein